MFENLAGSTWNVKRGHVGIVDRRSGETVAELREPGQLELSSSQAKLRGAVAARARAVKASSYSEFLSCLDQGIAAIEAYLNRRASLWNQSNQNDQLIDSRQQRVSFDDKIRKWVPRMTGSPFPLGESFWDHFKKLRQVRDDDSIHPKRESYTISLEELACLINMFRTGVCELLIRLHLAFDDVVPAVLIRARFAPNVVVTKKLSQKALCGRYDRGHG